MLNRLYIFYFFFFDYVRLKKLNISAFRHILSDSGRVWIRMPNWLGDLVMALPLVRALRTEHPDLRLTLLAKPQFSGLLERGAFADEIIALPPQGRGYWSFFRNFRTRSADLHLLFTNSFRGDLEAWLAGSRLRAGILRKGKPRPLLNRKWPLPGDLDEAGIHQTRLWERWWKEAGLISSVDLRPLQKEKPTHPEKTPEIGMICGSENSPEKRWPVGHWTELIRRLKKAFPSARIRLLGTPGDRAVTREIIRKLPDGFAEDLAGKTTLLQFADILSGCDLVVCNDTGGMHLANLLGTPLIGLFGPTNPVRTGPVFEAERKLLQPEGCPQTGGSPIEALEVNRVFAACETWMQGGAL